MTKIDPEHPVIRETDADYRGRPIIVEIHARHIAFRVKGLRTMSASLGIAGAFDAALLRQAQNRIELESGGEGKKRVRKKLSLIRK